MTVVRVCALCDQSWPCPAGLDGVEGHRSTERSCPPPPSPGPVLPGSIAASSLGPAERLFLAVYDGQSGMAQLNNVGVVSAIDAQAAQQKVAKIFGAIAGDIVHITPLSELADGWSYYTSCQCLGSMYTEDRLAVPRCRNCRARDVIARLDAAKKAGRG